VRSPTCEAHKCRCAKSIGDVSAPDGLRASKPACPPEITLYDERIARLVRAAQNIDRLLPHSFHQSTCASTVDRECGACDCGAEDAVEFRKALADMLQTTQRWGVLLIRDQPSGSQHQQWFFEGYPNTPWSGTHEEAQRRALRWNDDRNTTFYRAAARPLPAHASAVPTETRG
jgi:hypothetical protein